MNYPNYLSVQLCRLPLSVLVTACLLAGCSSSTDSRSSESEASADLVSSTDSSAAMDLVISPESSTPTDTLASQDSESNTTSGVLSDVADDGVLDEPVAESSITIETQAQSTIRVSFDITVPAYQSNELSIGLEWGDINLTASWVGDEYWTATAELPTETENLLTVTFYDHYGKTVLASFSQEFRTGSNVTEALNISADQLNADQYDDDGDGVNNLEELIAGRDPWVDEDSLLEVVDELTFTFDNRMSVAQDFEAQIADERPLLVMTEEMITEYNTKTLTINIDADGNGTLDRVHYFGISHIFLSGTRSHIDNTIAWDASRSAYDGDYGHNVSVNLSVTKVDENTRTIVEEFAGSNIGTYQFNWSGSTNLTAKVIEGSSMCEPLYGSISNSWSSNSAGFHETQTTITKDVDDRYWRVVKDHTATQFYSNKPNEVESSVSEFFARSLPDMFCDFVEF